MAKVDLQSVIKSLSGSLDKEDQYTFRRTRKGKTILIKKPDMSRVQWSPAQEAGRRKMADAIVFAKGVLADPKLKAAYTRRAKRKGSDAFHLAISEYMRPPKHH